MLLSTLFVFIPACVLSSVSARHMVSLSVPVALLAGFLFVSSAGVTSAASALFAGALAVTSASLFVSGVLCVSAVAVWVLWPSVRFGSLPIQVHSPTFFMALCSLLALLGGCLLPSSGDFVVAYLALELQSYSLYLMCAVYFRSERAVLAGLIYFMVGGLASGFVLLGFALNYSVSGCMGMGTSSLMDDGFVGTFLVVSGLLVKLGAAPLHFWSPVVYDGVPTVIAAWLTSLPKVALVGLLWTVLAPSTLTLLALVSGLSLFVGNAGGLVQTRIKRMLAFSGISHLGFIFLGLCAFNLPAVGFYLTQYALTTVWMFGLVLALGYASGTLRGDLGYFSELRGVGELLPALGISLCLALFSLGGVPPLVGFYAKLGVFLGGFSSGLVSLTLLACGLSVVGMVYYLNAVASIAFFVEVRRGSGPVMVLSTVHSYSIAVLTLLVSCYILSPVLESIVLVS